MLRTRFRLTITSLMEQLSQNITLPISQSRNCNPVNKNTYNINGDCATANKFTSTKENKTTFL